MDTILFLINNNKNYEIRTTLMRTIHTKEELQNMSYVLIGFGKNREMEYT